MFAIQNRPPKGLSDPQLWSSEFNDFVQKCLSYNPDQRPSAADLLDHPFIIKYRNRKAILNELVINSID